MPDALLVADNRANSNVGCRATSIALDDLVSIRFTVTGAVPGTFIVSPLPAQRWRKVPGTKRLAQRAVATELGWELARRLPAEVRPDLAMADPARVARDLLDAASRDPVAAKLVEQFRSADVVVINGEGDMIFTTPPRRTLIFVLSLIELATELGVPCAYVNAMVSDHPATTRSDDALRWSARGLARCALVAVRDRWSVDLIRELDLCEDPVWVPDALFSWVEVVDALPAPTPHSAQGFPFEGRGIAAIEGDYVCLTGSSAYSPRGMTPPLDAYEQMVVRLRAAGVSPILVEGSAADEFLREIAARQSVPLLPWATNIYVLCAVLARARVLIGGRHHPSILAALGGCRPLMIGSNSHKNTSLLEVMGISPATERVASLSGRAADEMVDECLELLDTWTSDRRGALRDRCRELGEQTLQLPHLIDKAIS